MRGMAQTSRVRPANGGAVPTQLRQEARGLNVSVLEHRNGRRLVKGSATLQKRAQRAIGSQSENLLPTPSTLSISILPPWRLATWDTIERPRPIPAFREDWGCATR